VNNNNNDQLEALRNNSCLLLLLLLSLTLTLLLLSGGQFSVPIVRHQIGCTVLMLWVLRGLQEGKILIA